MLLIIKLAMEPLVLFSKLAIKKL